MWQKKLVDKRMADFHLHFMETTQNMYIYLQTN